MNLKKIINKFSENELIGLISAGSMIYIGLFLEFIGIYYVYLLMTPEIYFSMISIFLAIIVYFIINKKKVFLYLGMIFYFLSTIFFLYESITNIHEILAIKSIILILVSAINLIILILLKKKSFN